MTPSATCTFTEARAQIWDVTVVGAGPAGALAAHSLALCGLRVLLLDKKSFPRPKVCGGCLNQRSLALLASAGMGDLLDELAAPILNRFRLGVGGRDVTLPIPNGRAVSRDTFDAHLVSIAIASGVDFLPDAMASLEGVSGDTRSLRIVTRGGEERIASRLVLCAAGLGSGDFLRSPNNGEEVSARSRVGGGITLDSCSAAYEEGIIYMAVAKTGYVGAVRTEGGRLNFAAAIDRKAASSRGFGPAAVEILKCAGFPSMEGLEAAKWRGTLPLTRRPHAISAERVFFLGDAAGYVEPFTGEGMAWAFESAVLVTPLVLKAMHEWRPELMTAWSQVYKQAIGRRRMLCHCLSCAVRIPPLMRAAVGFLTAFPTVAAPVVRRLNAIQISNREVGNRLIESRISMVGAGKPLAIQPPILPGQGSDF